jgi:hypothetical protein
VRSRCGSVDSRSEVGSKVRSGGLGIRGESVGKVRPVNHHHDSTDYLMKTALSAPLKI